VKVNEVIAILLEEGEDADPRRRWRQRYPAWPGPKADAPLQPEPKADAVPRLRRHPSAKAPPASGCRRWRTHLCLAAGAPACQAINGLDLKALSGSGPHGRIVKKDVEAISEGTGKAAAAPAATAAEGRRRTGGQGPVDDAVLKNFEEGSYELVKHDGMRKTIARRLQESKQTIPHFYVTVDCELDALLALRPSSTRPRRPTRTASLPTSSRSTTW
jgi:pyruvate dehydrogenase E2 component (dihydrolipoamide acetyltransferase)